MSQLPPDPSRLRAILAHLDRQIAENDTVGRYLRLQYDAVQKALARAEKPALPPRRPSRPVKGGGSLPAFAPAQGRTGYVVQRQRTPTGPDPALIHLADCSMIEGAPHRIRADEARAALTDPTIERCTFCRPDTELGVDLA
ncbi:DUF6233 domain-containing protein [Streptomyces sp. NPDC006393]|uniref:DUF6233 domain-containing protein n=1 Tax=Streptomyces sp. NPDC006393 TaxID=3156763 RepID=UPI0033DB3C73